MSQQNPIATRRFTIEITSDIREEGVENILANAMESVSAGVWEACSAETPYTIRFLAETGEVIGEDDFVPESTEEDI